MELLIPCLATLLLAVAIAFFVLPRFAPAILVAGSSVALLLAMYIHWSKFGTMEYERATWIYTLRQYTSYILVASILLGAVGFYAMNNSGSNNTMISALATPALPPITTPVVGGGMKSLLQSVTSRVKGLIEA